VGEFAMITQAERQAYIALLEVQASKWNPLVALTLSYNVPVSVARIRRDLSSLHTHIDRELLGRRFYKRQPHERSEFWAVIESMSFQGGVIGPTHRHVHCGWKMPPSFGIDDLRKILDGGLWLRFVPHGSYDAQEYRLGWASYSTKFLTDPENIIDSADFLRR
jgi:hypothetical protein